MKPRLVIVTVIADFVASVGNLPNRLEIFFAGGVLPDDEKRDVQISLAQKLKRARHNYI